MSAALHCPLVELGEDRIVIASAAEKLLPVLCLSSARLKRASRRRKLWMAQVNSEESWS